MKLAFLLGLLSVTMVMGKTAKLAEMAKLPEMAEDSRDQVSCIQDERYVKFSLIFQMVHT